MVVHRAEALRGLPEAMASLRGQGYAVLRGVFVAEEIADASARIDRLLGRVGRPPPGTWGLDGAEVVVGEDGAVARVVWVAGADDGLDAFTRDRRLVGIASAALGGTEFEQLISQLHPKEPGDGVAFGWHQDAVHRRFGTPLWHDPHRSGRYLQCLVAIDPCGPDNGPLEFVPHSHLRGPLAHDERRVLPDGAFDRDAARMANLAPGDVAIFGPFTIHGSGPNRGQRSRRVLVSGFALPGTNSRRYPGSTAGRHVSLARRDPRWPRAAGIVSLPSISENDLPHLPF